MLHVITGGSGSGKSAYAENWLLEQREKNLYDENSENTNPSAPLYIATMIPYGKEGETKVFRTFECYRDLAKADIPVNTGILLECMSNLTANELYDEAGNMNKPEKVKRQILEGIRHVIEKTDLLVIVTNEVQGDQMEYSEETKIYQRVLGEVNQSLAGLAEKVTEVVYGIPVEIK